MLLRTENDLVFQGGMTEMSHVEQDSVQDVGSRPVALGHQ